MILFSLKIETTMSKIFITGSADGLGQLAARELVASGHQVVLHARNEKRGEEAFRLVPGAEGVVTGDLSSIAETKDLAKKLNDLGAFDVVIHNAGVYQTSPDQLLAVNTLAPYILTCLVKTPKRLIYLSSDMHSSGAFKSESLRAAAPKFTYSDTKLHVLMLCKAVARCWQNVYANALNPGWVPTKMGGRNAPDDLKKGYETQVWLATSSDKEAQVSGCYFYHKKQTRYNPQADDEQLQDQLLNICGDITGVPFIDPLI